MPTKPKYTPGLPRSRHVSDHAPRTQRKQDEGQRRIDRMRSSARWQRVRARKLRRQPLCEECQRDGLTTSAVQVDHITPLRVRPDLAFAMHNLQSLCIPHHARKSARERQG